MAVGADSIEDLGVLRHGALPRLFGGVRAPSTLGTFLRGFTWGNVRQLDAVARQTLIGLARNTPVTAVILSVYGGPGTHRRTGVRLRQRRAVFMVAGLLAALLVLAAITLDGRVASSWWLGVVLPVSMLGTAVLMSRFFSGRMPPATLDVTIEALAQTVHHQWSAEAVRRGLYDPEPLHVMWAAPGPPIADRWIGVSPSDVSSELRTVGWSEDVAELFSRVPSRRLVIIGPPGSGKTVLAIQLTLDLLGQRQLSDRVPVLLPMSSWDPTVRSYRGWLVDRLVADYPVLVSDVEPGRSAAEVLVRDGRLLVVLDGLDEMPAQRRIIALEQLNRSLTAEDALVLTSRAQEYADLVESTGDVLGRAAVIELQPLSPATVVEYLRYAAPGPATVEPLARLLDDGGRDPTRQLLWRVLSSPLMVNLFRMTYCVPSADPEELLDRDRFPDAPSIEDHLLRSWLANWPPGPAFNRSRAEGWLSFLAAQLARSGRQELAWWELDQVAPMWAPACAGAVLAGAGVGAAVTAGYGPGPGLIAAAISAVAAAGLGFMIRRRNPGVVRAASFHAWHPGGVTRAFLIGLAAAAPLGLAATQVTGWVFGVVVGVVLCAAIGVTAWLARPTSEWYPANTAVTLRASRLLAAASWLALALAVAVVWSLVAYRLGVDNVTVGLVAAAATLTWPTNGSAWGRFTAARVWLAARGLLPWRYLRFLEEMRRAGLMRQIGPSYQFAHIRLRDALADGSWYDPTRRGRGGARR